MAPRAGLELNLCHLAESLDFFEDQGGVGAAKAK